MNKNHGKVKKIKGILGLGSAVATIYVMTFFVLPAITNSCSSFRTLADFIDSSGIDTGQFYYTDVEIVTQADIGARSSIQHYKNKQQEESK